MKRLTGLVLLTCLLQCCQQKQYFTSSPEIDLVKKANDAYYSRDWETLRSCYADTSKTWINAWHSRNKGLNIDTLVSLYKAGAVNFASFSMADGPEI